MFIIKPIVKGVASGIGLAREASAAHKANKTQKETGKSPVASNQHLDTSQSDPTHEANDDSSGDSNLEEDELDWELDEASRQAEGKDRSKEDAPPTYTETVDEIVDEFSAHHPAPSYSPPQGRLECPVVLPQKRPRNRERGFVRAYAPMLADCGIDQATFLEFLDDFDRSTHADQYLTVINAAAAIVGLVPNPISLAVSISVQFAAGTARWYQSTTRKNTFLDQMNDKLFRPHGLYCMVMTYKPDQESSDEPILISSIATKAMTPADSKFKQQLKLLKLSSGTSKGELEIPEAAPLIYPAMDEATLKKTSSAASFVRDYKDKRAQAVFAYQNPGSKLAVPEAPQFVSRYSDPNHPASSGSIVSLVTGGKIDPTSRKRAKRAAKRDRKRMMRGEAPLTEAEKRTPKPKLLGRIMKKHLFYMIIVNMPSQEEMDAVLASAMAKEGGEGMSGRKSEEGMSGRRSEEKQKEASAMTEQDVKMDL